MCRIIIEKNTNIFPNKLKNVKPSVKKIYAQGNVELLDKKSIAIIGSRNYSDYGKRMTIKITKELVECGYVIISGLANGIDSIAHKICIDNYGETIAILGSGLNKIYPKENIKLAERIVENGGLILTEYSDDEPVQKKNFPRRNRIISGLSDAVLVVEGSYRSGTSITANYAFSQGKKVFYVPNCYENKNSFESIKLAKSGGIAAVDGSDIWGALEGESVDEYDAKMRRKYAINKEIIASLDIDSKRVFNCLIKQGSLDSCQIAERINIDIAKVNQILSMLELNELVENTEISKYRAREEFCE